MDYTCVAITTLGCRCSRRSRYGNLCTLHYNRNLDLVNQNQQNQNQQNQLQQINQNQQNEIDEKNEIIISLSQENAELLKKLNLVKNSNNTLNNENKSLTNIKLWSENKFTELNNKIINLTESNVNLENKILEIQDEYDKKLKVRVNLLKDEYKNNILDNEKYTKLHESYTKIKSDLNLITRELIGDKIGIKHIEKNNLKFVIKYFLGTEKNIDEFILKFEKDLDNLIDSFVDNKYKYDELWTEKVITNNENYLVNFDKYFIAQNGNKIKINWIKNKNKYIVQIYPDIDHNLFILDEIKNKKKIVTNSIENIELLSQENENFKKYNEEIKKENENLLHLLEIKEKTIKDGQLCNICVNDKINVVFIPCFHGFCCLTCSNKLVDCPICRKKICKKQKIYLS